MKTLIVKAALFMQKYFELTDKEAVELTSGIIISFMFCVAIVVGGTIAYLLQQ